jgi:plastocyanin
VYGHVRFSRGGSPRDDACKGEILMPFSWLININAQPPGSVQLDPNPQNASVGDEIVWANNDGREHWPGLANGTLNTTFFMPNKIAPDSTSSTFRPGSTGTLNYACSIHPNDPNEKGTINVT